MFHVFGFYLQYFSFNPDDEVESTVTREKPDFCDHAVPGGVHIGVLMTALYYQ
jgi:hypothetical protein